MRKKGKVRSWNEQKAFGFIQPSEGGNDVFLHISGMRNRNRVPALGQIVTYTLSTDKQGRPCAANALLPDERAPHSEGEARSDRRRICRGSILVLRCYSHLRQKLVSVDSMGIFDSQPRHIPGLCF